MAQNNGGEKGSDIYKENGLSSEFLVSVENCGDKDGKNEQGSKFGAEIVGIFAVIVAVVEAPEKCGGDSDFDVLPGGLINGSKKADGTVLAGEIVEEMSQSTCG